MGRAEAAVVRVTARWGGVRGGAEAAVVRAVARSLCRVVWQAEAAGCGRSRGGGRGPPRWGGVGVRAVARGGGRRRGGVELGEQSD